MTQEEKAKAYDEALERAKQLLEIGLKDTRDKRVVLSFFPELKDSEDEKIRKAILELVRQSSEILGMQNQSNMLAWLEKQGERKPASKVEPKFKNGQWIVWQDKYYKVNYNGCGYELVDQNGLSTSLEYGTIEENAHLWTIQDAKDGDVLVDVYGNIGICEQCDDFDWVSYCSLGCKGGFQHFKIEHENEKTYPATKEQRETLIKAMTDAGYTFEFEKKELKKIDPSNKELEGKV